MRLLFDLGDGQGRIPTAAALLDMGHAGGPQRAVTHTFNPHAASLQALKSGTFMVYALHDGPQGMRRDLSDIFFHLYQMISLLPEG